MEAGYKERSGGADDWYVPRLGLLPSAAEGFVICLESGRNPLASFYAFPYRRKVWPSDIPVLRVARPILRTRREWDSSTARNLVSAVRLTARAYGLNTVELELYSEVWGPIFYPSSPTAIDACNDPRLPLSLGQRVDLASRPQVVLQLDPAQFISKGGSGGIQGAVPDSPADLAIRPLRGDVASDREAYLRLWVESGVLPANPEARAPKFGGWRELRPWYSDVSRLLSRDDFILLAEQSGTPVGLVHWWPNLYGLATRLGRTVVGEPPERAPELAREVGEAKAFKLAVSPKAGGAGGPVGRALVAAALKRMAQDYGVVRAQVVVPPEGAKLSAWLKGLGAEVVQKTIILSMRA